MNQNLDGWGVPTEPSGHRSDDLIGELVALRPVTSDEIVLDTSNGPSPARFVEALILDPDNGSYRNLGELPIFWQVIRRQLAGARPWLVGRIIQPEGSRAYRIVPPAQEHAGFINTVLRNHVRNPRPVEPLPDSAETEIGPDEAPF